MPLRAHPHIASPGLFTTRGPYHFPRVQGVCGGDADGRGQGSRLKASLLFLRFAQKKTTPAEVSVLGAHLPASRGGRGSAILPCPHPARGLRRLTALPWASDAGIARHMSSDSGNGLSHQHLEFLGGMGWVPGGAWRGWPSACPCQQYLQAVFPHPAVPYLPTEGPTGPVPRQLFLVVATCVSPWHPVSSLLVSGQLLEATCEGAPEPCCLRSHGQQVRGPQA